MPSSFRRKQGTWSTWACAASWPSAATSPPPSGTRPPPPTAAARCALILHHAIKDQR